MYGVKNMLRVKGSGALGLRGSVVQNFAMFFLSFEYVLIDENKGTTGTFISKPCEL